MQQSKKADAPLLSCALLLADHEEQHQKGDPVLCFNAPMIASCYLKGRLSTSTPAHQPRSAMQRSLSVPEVKHYATGERAFSVRGHNCELSHEQRNFWDQPALCVWTEAFWNLAAAGRTCPMQLMTAISRIDLTSQSLSLTLGKFTTVCILIFLTNTLFLGIIQERFNYQMEKNLGTVPGFKRQRSVPLPNIFTGKTIF